MRRAVYIVLLVLILIILSKWFSGSLFLTAPERLQVLVYGRDSRIYSIDMRGNSHYIIHFAPNEKISVPGGYGYYRVGALGKLVSLEHKPQILGKAFSVASSTFVTYYFYPARGDIYNGDTVSRDVIFPRAEEVFGWSSNANIFDRLYLFLHFLQVKKSDYLLLRSRGDSQDKNGARIFVPENFSKETEGYLFNSAYRSERKTVQILYTEDYNAARDIGKIMEGSGIRVVDIKKEAGSDSKCSISDITASRTTRAMSAFFGCGFTERKNGVSDILFDMRGIEKEWSTQ